MKIRKILIEETVKEKIKYKHRINPLEIEQTLFNNPYTLKIRNNLYMTIGHHQKYITIIFELIKDTAFIKTAYPSSEAQRKLYKLKRE